MEPVIVIEHVCKRFGPKVVLNDFNLVVGKEENVVVLGKSGSGKSVLIKCVIGLLHADSGRIVMLDKNIPDLNHDDLDRIRAKVGFLFQSNALYDSMTVRKNLEFPLRRHWFDLSQDKIDDMVKEALENVGLAHTVDMMPEELSGGMSKRVALARTLILKPDIILYDEPTTGLDPVTAREISKLIVDIQRKFHTASIIISHDMHCVKQVSDRVALLDGGKCYWQGKYEEMEARKKIKQPRRCCRWRVTKSIYMNTLQQSPTSPDDTFNKEECHKELRTYHNKLFDLQNKFYADGRFSLLIILQGIDTAGKDGIIRHVLSCMNPMGIQVKSFKTPTVDEERHDFLWRIFPHFPAKGMMEVFNRSYYEDIVVPFIGKKLTKEKLHERCELINALEKNLEDSGTYILKFFLNVSHEEQKGRIKERLDQPRKRWKYDQADKVAADRYDDYIDGYDKIINECHSNQWHIIPADQKWYRNYLVAKILTEYLEAMPLKFPGAKTALTKPSP